MREFTLCCVAEARYDQRAMPLRAVGVTALLTVADWGAWTWASSSGQPTIGMIAGILLVPLAVALAGFLALTILAAARIGAQRARSKRGARRDATPRGGGTSSPPASRAARGRIVA